MMMRKIIYLFLCAIVCFGCVNRNVIVEGDFITVYNKAQTENKKLWVMFGGGERCRSCNDIIKEMIDDGVMKKYRDEYLFYKCNIENPSNKFMQYILLMQQIPNSYIFDENGRLIYASASNENLQSIKASLKLATPDRRYHYAQGQFVTKKSRKLLEMLNHTIDANICYINGVDGSNAIGESIALEPYFYNLYLKYKICLQIGDTLSADSCKMAIKECAKVGWQAVVYDKLCKELDLGVEPDSAVAKLKLNGSVINIGTLKYGLKDTVSVDLVNEGNKPLILYQVATDCSCIETSFEKRPIMPGVKSTVNFVYEASRKGNFSRNVMIQSNAVNRVERIVIKGNVK